MKIVIYLFNNNNTKLIRCCRAWNLHVCILFVGELVIIMSYNTCVYKIQIHIVGWCSSRLSSGSLYCLTLYIHVHTHSTGIMLLGFSPWRWYPQCTLDFFFTLAIYFYNILVGYFKKILLSKFDLKYKHVSNIYTSKLYLKM